jgi:hypothetical protein
MGFLDGLISELTGDYTGTDASNGSKIGVALGNLLKQSANNYLPNQSSSGSVIYTESCGDIKKNHFIKKICGDINLTATFLQQYLNGAELDRLSQRAGDDWDEEDQRVIENVAVYINSNYNYGNRATFLHVVQRGGNDGWVVWSNFNASDGFLHGVYYFLVK